MWEDKGPFFELALKSLRPTLIERDQAARFDRDTFSEFGKAGLFLTDLNLPLFNRQRTDQVRNYYQISRASLDLPFTSSLAAHGFVSRSMMQAFATEPMRRQYWAGMLAGQVIGAICNSEDHTSINLKEMKARLEIEPAGNRMTFTKPCITNGGIADLFFTTLWNLADSDSPKLELFVLERDEVHSKSITSTLSGFRSGDSGSVIGQNAKGDVLERRLASHKDTLFALRYCFYIERLIVGTMAAGIAHGVEDLVLEDIPWSLEGATGDKKQYLQDKMCALHMTRTKMNSLIETVVNRGIDRIFECDSQLATLKVMISRELREAVFGVIEVVGHRALTKEHILPKVVRDLEMCSFFGGTPELQKVGLIQSLMPKKPRALK